MKKRLLAILMILLLAISLVSCGGKKDDDKKGSTNDSSQVEGTKKTSAEIMEEVNQNLKKLSDLSCMIEMEMKMSVEGMELVIPMTMDTKIKDYASSNPTSYIKMTMSMLGQEMAYDIYQVDGWVYTAANGTKVKTRADSAGATTDMDDIVKELPTDIVNKFEFVENADGSQSITIKIPEETFSEIFAELMESTASTTGETGDMSISNAIVDITVKDGYYTEYNMSFDMKMVSEGTEVDASVTASVDYKDLGKPVTIDLPNDLNTYQDASGTTAA